jgi:hypothetical protein
MLIVKHSRLFRFCGFSFKPLRGGNMRNLAKAAFCGFVLLASVTASLGQSQNRGSLVIVFKDGHRQSFSVAEVNKIEFKAANIVVIKDGGQQSFPLAEVQSFDFDSSATSFPMGRNHFLGKWKVGEGNGGTFYITLEADGKARKSIGSNHGTWMVVDGEAHISWDDGWHDAIRKVGSKHQKVAFEPGKSFSDEPNNVTDAVNTTAQPI